MFVLLFPSLATATEWRTREEADIRELISTTYSQGSFKSVFDRLEKLASGDHFLANLGCAEWYSQTGEFQLAMKYLRRADQLRNKRDDWCWKDTQKVDRVRDRILLRPLLIAPTP